MESVLLFILGVAVIVVGLAVSIGLHEIGHLVPAKLFGVKVTQYMIGFGPTLWSKKKGETEYGFKAIPLGGYISMIGMFPPKNGGAVQSASTGFFDTLVQEGAPEKRADDKRPGAMATMVDDARQASADTIGEGEQHRAFYTLPVYKRIIIMLGGPTMNLLIAIVMFAILLMGFGTTQTSTTVGSVSSCVLPATSERQSCESGDEAAPGAAAGLRPGDRFVSINGTAITSWSQSTQIIRDAPGRALPVVVDRAGTDVSLTITPKLTERFVLDSSGDVVTDTAGNQVTEKVGFVGIGAAGELVRQPVTSVMPAVGDTIASTAGIIIHLPQRLVDVANAAFGPGERDPNGPMSMVGVGRVAGEIASIDTIPVASKIATMVGILGSVNIALFVFNLVPLLPLDGGHVAGALWEGIRRAFAKLFRRPEPGPVDMAKLMPLTLAVVVLLGGMSLLLMYADIVKPVNLFG